MSLLYGIIMEPCLCPPTLEICWMIPWAWNYSPNSNWCYLKQINSYYSLLFPSLIITGFCEPVYLILRFIFMCSTLYEWRSLCSLVSCVITDWTRLFHSLQRLVSPNQENATSFLLAVHSIMFPIFMNKGFRKEFDFTASTNTVL